MADTDFYRPDGPYSWIVLALVIVNTFSSYGFIAGNIGVLTDVLPDLLNEDQATTNIVPSMSISVYLFGSKSSILLYFILMSQLSSYCDIDQINRHIQF